MITTVKSFSGFQSEKYAKSVAEQHEDSTKPEEPEHKPDAQVMY